MMAGNEHSISLLQLERILADKFLLPSLVVSTLLLGIVGLWVAAHPRASAARRFAIWQSAFFSLGILTLASPWLPTLPLGWQWNVASDPLVTNAATGPSPPSLVSNSLATPLDWNSLSGSDRNQASEDEGRTIRRDIAVSPALATNIVADSQPLKTATASDTPLAQRFANGPRWLVLLWLSITLLLLLRLLIGNFVATRRLYDDSHFDEELSRMHQLPIYHSQSIAAAAVCGLFSPRILLPVDARQWSTPQLQMTLAHELAHLRRQDLRLQYFNAIVTAIFWFQPLAWWGQSMMRSLREQACDDEVVDQGYSATTYAEVLLQMACRFSDKPIPSIALVSMAQKPIERRLRSVLDPTTIRQKNTWRFQTLLLLGCMSVTMILATVRPFQPLANAQSTPLENNQQESKQPPVTDDSDTAPTPAKTLSSDTLPDFLTGIVVDPEGNPVSDCQIHAQVYCPTDDKPTQMQITHLPVATTDDQGRYQLKTAGIQKSQRNVVIRGYVRPSQHPDINIAFGIKHGESSLPPIQLRAGRKIRGQIHVPAGSPSAKNLTLHLTGDRYGAGFEYWSSAPIVCQPDGSYQAWAPVAGRVEMTVYADNYAPKVVRVPDREDTLEPITLHPGTAVLGRLLDKAGQPIPNVNLVLEHLKESGTRGLAENALFVEPHRQTQTDAQGRFQFHPMQGHCCVSVVQAQYNAARWDSVPIIEKNLPLIPPLKLELLATNSQLQMDLQEGPTVEISGTVRWEDGTPAQNVSIQLSLSNDQVNREVAKTATDDSGNYRLNIPTSAKRSHLLILGWHTHDGKSQTPYPDNSLGHQRGHRTQSFGPLQSSLTNVDWKFQASPKPNKSVAAPQLPERARTDADLALQEIDRAYFQNGSLTDSWTQQDLVDALLKFEQKYRGEHAAMVALHHLLQLNDPLVKQQATELISKHYLQHPFVDCCIGALLNSALDFALDSGQIDTSLVDQIIQVNPSPIVRASASLEELELLAHAIQTVEFLKQRQWDWNMEEKPVTVKEKEQAARSIEFLKAQNLPELYRRANQLISELKSDYKSLVRTHFRRGGTMYFADGTAVHSETLIRERTNGNVKETYGELAQRVDFQLNRLAVGQPVPELNTNDLDGHPIRLSDYRGKKVLIYVRRPYRQDYLEFQKRMDALRTQFDGQLELIGIHLTHAHDDIRDILNERQNGWPVIMETEEGTRFEGWDRDGMMILVDENGIIRRHLALEERLVQVLQ